MYQINRVFFFLIWCKSLVLRILYGRILEWKEMCKLTEPWIRREQVGFLVAKISVYTWNMVKDEDEGCHRNKIINNGVVIPRSLYISESQWKDFNREVIWFDLHCNETTLTSVLRIDYGSALKGNNLNRNIVKTVGK